MGGRMGLPSWGTPRRCSRGRRLPGAEHVSPALLRRRVLLPPAPEHGGGDTHLRGNEGGRPLCEEQRRDLDAVVGSWGALGGASQCLRRRRLEALRQMVHGKRSEEPGGTTWFVP